MTYGFNPAAGLVMASLRLSGPTGQTVANVAVDTGATSTVIRDAILVSVGYDPAGAKDRTRITTGSGIAFVPRLIVAKVEALGQVRDDFVLLAHTLPPSASVDGLLGLDFLRDRRLTIDFRKGRVSVS